MYKAYDEQNNIVALKEFYPYDHSVREDNGHIHPLAGPENEKTFHEAMQKFEIEAQLLLSLHGLGSAPKLYKLFFENSTAYCAMEYLKGNTLLEYMKRERAEGRGVMTVEEAVLKLEPIFLAVAELHRNNILHRDIGPDNIFIYKNKKIRLIDFGNARVQEKGKSRDVDWAKRGYSPIELFDPGFRQDTWTDIYALAATLYYTITGDVPVPAQDRIAGAKLVSPIDKKIDITPEESAAIMKALSVVPEERYSDVMEFFRDLVSSWRYEGIVIGLDGQYRGKEISLDKDRKYTLGCRDDCDIPFEKGTPGVSRMHGSLIWDVRGYALYTDEGSTYGSRRLGGELIEPHIPLQINEGEGFVLGDDQVFAIKKKMIKTKTKKIEKE